MKLKTYDEMDFHPTSEKLVEILCKRTQNSNPLFFRVSVAFYWSMLASMMRTVIDTPDRGILPINLYAINLATSGAGKGHSTNTMEEEVINQFEHNFREQVFPLLAMQNLPKIANQRAIRYQRDPDEELVKVEKEFDRQGPLSFSFSSGTASAVRQARHKLLMADAGSVNLIMDEVGDNLTGNSEMFPPFLELYDKGKIKGRLLKNTGDNVRDEDIPGVTPTNVMLFGTPSRLLDGGKVEDEFYAMLESGWARRCFFGFQRFHTRKQGMTADELFKQRTSTQTDSFLEDLSDHLGDLADLAQVNKKLQVSEKVAKMFIQYQLDCESIADTLGEHHETKKAELAHRHFKAMKLAGAYAFIDGLPEITEDHAYYAIKMAEHSGEAFHKMLTRDRPYVKLAKYIADVRRPITQVDMIEDLPFYKGSASQRADLMSQAVAWGYQNNIIIKKTFSDGVEFVRGETLDTTDLGKLLVSYSDDIATGYREDTAKWEDLHLMTQAKGVHWCNHYFQNGHRTEDNAIPGFNLIVLDVEKSCTLQQAQDLLKEYKALFYTTKRHTKDDHRFRIVLPTNYYLELDSKDYKDFMRSLFDWLPFPVDDQTGQRSRKWLSHAGKHWYQDGELLDVLPFIPKTSKNEEFKQRVLDQQGMDNLERWVLNNSGDGNRNNMLLRYAMIMVDGGFDFDQVRERVFRLNEKMPDNLDESELVGTIMVTVGKALAKRAA